LPWNWNNENILEVYENTDINDISQSITLEITTAEHLVETCEHLSTAGM